MLILGQNSPKNTAESTGMLPPTPNPTTANREANVTKFGAPPAARPNTPAMNSVKLKGHLRCLHVRTQSTHS